MDDDPSFRELYKTALRLEGFDVLTAADGIEALHIVEGGVPSMLILDLAMPCLDGSSVLSELRSHPETKDTPVIVVTGSDLVLTLATVVAVLHKPISPEQLMPVITRHLPVV